MTRYLLITFLSLLFFTSCNNPDSKTESDEITKDSVETIESLSEKIRENPEVAQLFIQRANLQIDAENIPEAINDFEIALRVDSLLPNAYSGLCDLYLMKGESGKAKDLMLKCLDIFPMNAEARLKLAQIYFYVQMYREAMHEIVNLETNKLQSSDSYFVKALILNETQDFVQAINALQKAIEYDGQNWEAYNLIGMIYYRLEDPLGVEYFVTASKLFPTNIEIRFNAAVVFQHFDMFDKALAEYDYVISVDSLFYQAYYNKGYINVNKTGNLEEAVENFTYAIKIDSAAYKAWYNRGYAYESMGKFKLAELDYRQTLEILPNYDNAIVGLNEVIAKQRY